MKRDPFRDLTLCNKMFDFIGMRKAAIVSRTRSVEEYFGPSCFEMFTADDPQDLARAIRRLYRDPERRRQLAERALAVSEPYNWPAQRRAYQAIVDSLVAGGRVRSPEPAPQPSGMTSS
jgi:glycosyltransferase involved in cell wall biosynthesis